ncbi:MAG: DUF5074 domain-containing protein [Muribaculum sp.]|nr:DUF5074 domain-containing protein [Muribaculum sp.]
MLLNRLYSFLGASMLTLAQAVASDIDYTKGVFFVNEDWYGHQNSTINYLLPDATDGQYWHYRVFQSENPGYELGCTNQFGDIWNGRFYLIAKQEKDPGASITGGRITVADAKTMKVLHQSPIIDPSGAQCDGRGFLGIDEHKGYISSSNGIWIFNLDTYAIEGQVTGTANPNAGDGRPNTDPTGSLYHGQSGSMVISSGRVFAAHQQEGLLVIDPETDKVTDKISMDIVASGAGIGSVVKSKDGTIWLSVAKNVQGTGTTLPYIVKVDPQSLSTKIVPIPEGMYPPSNSWYAWTPDAFCASSQTNSLYWKGGENRWFSGTKIFKYDIDGNELTQIIDLDDDGENWKLYGCSMRLHPITDEIYMSLYHDFGTPTYITRRYTCNGVKIKDYDMIMNYWFPSLPVFPQSGGQSSGIAYTALPKVDIYVSGQSLIVTGAEGSEVDIYTTDGRKVDAFKPWAETCALQPALQPGIYIAKAGSTVKKFRWNF